MLLVGIMGHVLNCIKVPHSPYLTSCKVEAPVEDTLSITISYLTGKNENE